MILVSINSEDFWLPWSQYFPSNPLAQEHWNPPIVFVQVAPFLQGSFVEHSLMSCQKNSKKRIVCYCPLRIMWTWNQFWAKYRYAVQHCNEELTKTLNHPPHNPTTLLTTHVRPAVRYFANCKLPCMKPLRVVPIELPPITWYMHVHKRKRHS